jgi:hypothetical protein
LRGSYVEIAPPIFANYLAEAALAGRTKELGHLFVTLGPYGRSRLLRRIRQLKGDVVAKFWDELFATGPLSGFTKAIEQPDLLRLVAPAVPDRVASLLHSGLVHTTVAERHQLQGHVRRELVWAVDQLLFRSKSAELALRCFALFAELVDGVAEGLFPVFLELADCPHASAEAVARTTNSAEYAIGLRTCRLLIIRRPKKDANRPSFRRA